MRLFGLGTKKPRTPRQVKLQEILDCPAGTTLNVILNVVHFYPFQFEWKNFLRQHHAGSSYVEEVCEAFPKQLSNYLQGYIEAPKDSGYTSRAFANNDAEDLEEISSSCRFEIRTLSEEAGTAMRLVEGDGSTEVVFENVAFELTYTPYGTRSEAVAFLPHVPRLTILPSGRFVFDM